MPCRRIDLHEKLISFLFHVVNLKPFCEISDIIVGCLIKSDLE